MKLGFINMDLEFEESISNYSPITCLMCKSNRKGDERLFMFGGNRPFIAKFEAKLSAFIGQNKLLKLQNRYKTNRGRSYICKHCYSITNKTFDNIKKIQFGISRSVRKVLSKDALVDENCYSDLGQDSNSQANLPKKKLPPVAERIAEKVASLTLVQINYRTPKIVLKPLIIKDNSEDCKKNNSGQRSYISENDSINSKSVQSKERNIQKEIIDTEIEFTRPEEVIQKISRTQTESVDTLNINSTNGSDCEKVKPSYSDQQSLSNDTNIDKNCDNISENETHLSTGLLQFTIFKNSQKDIKSKAHLSSAKPSPEKLCEILANPLLLIKSPQPIKLQDVKNMNVFICGENGCDWIFSSRFFWENHIRHYHFYGKPHKCPFDGCNKYFPTKSKQKQHFRKHTGERPFVCEECGKAFSGSQELRIHGGTHAAGKPYQCLKSGCYKSFKYINSLKRHLQFHDGNYPFPCSFPKCTKAFKNKYELKCHNRLHTGEKPYKCQEPDCGQVFRLPCEYTKHRRAHTGERPFRCSWDGCSAAYITCGGLSSHMLSHSNDQHFCCEFCGKIFKHKVSYQAHLKRHTSI